MVFFLSKRKGADFKHLLDEGLSKCHQVVSFHSLEDFLAEEFMHGVGPMLSVRGESILSWIGGGDFVVEDATTSTHELLDMLVIVERDLLSSFLEFDQLQTTGSEASSGHGPGRKPPQTEATLTISEESAFQDFSEKNKAVNQNAKVFVSGLTICNSDPFSLIQGSDVKGNLHGNQYGKSNQSTAPEPPAQFNVRALLSLRAGCPRLKPKLLSLKLDMLLGSLSETKLPDSSGFGFPTLPLQKTLKKEAATPLPLLARNVVASAKNTSTAATPDDVLDDLLEEASNLSNQNNLHQPLEMKGASYQILSSSPPSVTKSKVLDDFDLSSDTI
ncbi:phosphorelay protein [Salix suchowensis]|nr:phosphorelay protein [Salix suchowensis]